MQHLVIIDGHHLMYRAYWAIPRTMKTSKGEQVNAVFGVASMLLQILRTEQPDALLFCFDAGDETFRHQEYAEYKAGRSKTPDDFYVQIPRIHELIAHFGLPSVEGNNYEADDFACTYAKLAAESGARVTLVSGDRDLFQLPTDLIRVAVPHKGYQMPEYFTPDHVYAKFGVTPLQIPSYKGLVGDSSDNLPGVTGIGPKAATALIQQYGSITEIYNHLADIKPAWRAKLEAGREQAFFCERMAQLTCDIPDTLPLNDLIISPFHHTEILKFFSELEFHLLSKRLTAFLASPAGERYSFDKIFSDPAVSEDLPSSPKDDEVTQLSLL